MTLATKVGIMHDKLANHLYPKIVQYDEMLASFATLGGSWKETVQKHIVAADEATSAAQERALSTTVRSS